MVSNCHLDPSAYDGIIGTIRIRWTEPGKLRLKETVGNIGTLEMAKARLEESLYMTTVRLGNTQGVIMYNTLETVSF